MEELTKASHKLAEEIYKQTQAKDGTAGGDAGPGPQAGPQQGEAGGGDGGRKKPDDDVIDAEFREEKK
jgi:molecular chaperone DnaK